MSANAPFPLVLMLALCSIEPFEWGNKGQRA